MNSRAGKDAEENENPLRNLAASLSNSDRDRAVAHSTRRVVMASLGVLNDQKVHRKRSRALALAAVLMMLMVLGPLAWLVYDHVASGGHIGDLTTEFSLWVCILCPAILAAALVAGFLRNR